MATRVGGVTLTAVFEEVENGWMQVRIAELPEVVTAGPTIEDAKSLLADALREYLLSLAQDAEPVRMKHREMRESFELGVIGLT